MKRVIPRPAGGPALTVEIVTLFPELFDSLLGASLLGKAIAAGLVAVHRTNPRDFAAGRHKNVDDAPYGGGPGMVMRPEPLTAAVEHAIAARGPAHRVLLSPAGRLFDQARAEAFAARGRLLLVCGRYEGIDERVAELCADEVLSIGDYVLSGGEVAAAVIVEAVARLVPGVLGKGESAEDESFSRARLEYPHYTRPPSFRGRDVPPVLLSGDHAAVAAWRARQALERTRERRPDLLARRPPTDDELAPPAGRPARRRPPR